MASTRERFIEGMRVLVVGGIPAGVILVGVGSRVAMFILRLTSPDRVRGVTSDDGFTIGQVTLAGTYNLLVLGAVVGIIGAAAYQLVAPWLIGPTWFRRLTTGLASAAVVGSMLIHADGVDFTLLQPTWLAIGLFIALPGLFGTLIGPVVDSVSRPGSWTNRGRRRWLLPVVCVGCVPPAIPVVLFAAAVLGVWVLVSEAEPVQRVRRAPLYALAIRSAWLLIAVLGLVALLNDAQAVVSA
ncbi:MAG TPA: hypothetical protein VIT64_10405 [Ilumatobacteraceae bacterium]